MSDSNKDRYSRQIHLVSEADQPAASLQGTARRIEVGEYIADILVDNRSYPVVVHWIVQRRGDPEILRWGHEDDSETAAREAVAWIDSHRRHDDFRKHG